MGCLGSEVDGYKGRPCDLEAGAIFDGASEPLSVSRSRVRSEKTE